VFRLDDEAAISRVADGATLDRARAAEVVDGCPSMAISILED
jgi:ferredoxin